MLAALLPRHEQEPHALTDDFFMYQYKTHWCPIGVQHDWHTCVYAHNYQAHLGVLGDVIPIWSRFIGFHSWAVLLVSSPSLSLELDR